MPLLLGSSPPHCRTGRHGPTFSYCFLSRSPSASRRASFPPLQCHKPSALSSPPSLVVISYRFLLRWLRPFSPPLSFLFSLQPRTIGIFGAANRRTPPNQARSTPSAHRPRAAGPFSGSSLVACGLFFFTDSFRPEFFSPLSSPRLQSPSPPLSM